MLDFWTNFDMLAARLSKARKDIRVLISIRLCAALQGLQQKQFLYQQNSARCHPTWDLTPRYVSQRGVTDKFSNKSQKETWVPDFRRHLAAKNILTPYYVIQRGVRLHDTASFSAVVFYSPLC